MPGVRAEVVTVENAHPLGKKFKLNYQAMISICCLLKPLDPDLYGKELGDQLIDIDDTALFPASNGNSS